MKTHFDYIVNPRSFTEGDLVLLYDQANDKLGAGKFVPMWHGPFVEFDSVSLGRPRNGLYLKRYYA